VSWVSERTIPKDDSRLSVKLVPTFPDRGGSHVVIVTETEIYIYIYIYNIYIYTIYIYIDVDYWLCIIWIIRQQLWGYKVEEKLHLGYAIKKGSIPLSHSLGTRDYFLRDKVAGVWSWPLTSAAVKETWIYESSPPQDILVYGFISSAQGRFKFYYYCELLASKRSEKNFINECTYLQPVQSGHNPFFAGRGGVGLFYGAVGVHNRRERWARKNRKARACRIIKVLSWHLP
jgi:hypothetical protein